MRHCKYIIRPDKGQVQMDIDNERGYMGLSIVEGDRQEGVGMG